MQTLALHGRVVGTWKPPLPCVGSCDKEVPLMDRQLPVLILENSNVLEIPGKIGREDNTDMYFKENKQSN